MREDPDNLRLKQLLKELPDPPPEAFPRWSLELKANEAVAILEGEHFYLSTHRSFTCLTTDSGKVVWEYREMGLPLVHYPLDERIFLGQQKDETVVLVECTDVRLRGKPFQGPRLDLAETSAARFGMGCVILADGHSDDFYFDLKSLSIEMKHPPGPTVEWRGVRLLYPGDSPALCQPYSPTVALCTEPGSEQRHYAFNRAGEEQPSFTNAKDQDLVFGFDESGGKLTFRCWKRRA
ncbi:MAG: hypothetical protein WC314_12100 [Vulcanimicrobiota bacterium]